MMKTIAVLSLLALGSRSEFAGRLHGINYSLRIGPDWTTGAERCKSREQITSELSSLKFDMTDNVRVFSVLDCDTAATMLELTQSLDMGIWLGIWVGPNVTIFEDERARLLELLQTHSFENVLGIHVSSEAIYREDITPEEAMGVHFAIQDDLATAGLQNIPVTISDIIDTNLEFPELIKVDPNVVTFNMFPFWERTTDINNAAAYMESRIQQIEQLAEGRQIIITETGWADGGIDEDANIANPESMAKFFRDFICLAHDRGWQYFWFTSFDSDWRRVNEQSPDSVEGRFGLYDEQGVMKDHIRNLFIDCSEPRKDVSLFAAAGSLPPMVTASPISSGMINNIPPTSAPAATGRITDTIPTDPPMTVAPVSTRPTFVSNIGIPVDSFPSSAPPASDPNGFVQPTGTTITAPPVNNAGFVTPIPTQDIFSNNESKDPSCSANVLCSVRGLLGECCPAPGGVNLDCCGTVVIETCYNNPQCDALGLAGACCPTNDKIRFLDCCESVPDICLGDDNSNCAVISALEYKAELDAQQRSNGARLGMGFVFVSALLMQLGM